jgi:hypothetical protein
MGDGQQPRRRSVIVDHERRSVGAETTFGGDLPDGPELR